MPLFLHVLFTAVLWVVQVWHGYTGLYNMCSLAQSINACELCVTYWTSGRMFKWNGKWSCDLNIDILQLHLPLRSVCVKLYMGSPSSDSCSMVLTERPPHVVVHQVDYYWFSFLYPVASLKRFDRLTSVPASTLRHHTPSPSPSPIPTPISSPSSIPPTSPDNLADESVHLMKV